MENRPNKQDFIDFHSHNNEIEEGVFRIYNHLLKDDEELYSGNYSIGLHPWHINEFGSIDQLDEILESHISKDDCLFIGETGLDKVISTTIEQQEKVFIKHIQQSEKHSRPLIIHCVKAYQELFALEKKFNPKQTWIIHGFNGSQQLAADLILKGFYLSIGESLLENPEKARNVLKKIPKSKLFLETDEDELTIEELYDEVSAYYRITSSELQTHIFDNFIKLFPNDGGN